jgi:hypothetical protein
MQVHQGTGGGGAWWRDGDAAGREHPGFCLQ